MKTKELLLSKGFAADQIEEIEEGIQAGVDVTVYARKEYYAIQMRQILLGLKDNLPVEKYANPEYDWFQMEEIRKGLKAGLNVDAYAFPDVPHDTMHQIRKGLLENLDLSRYRDMNAGVLREFRKALASNLNIVKYIKEGYETEQLREIRYALEQGVDIDPYLQKEFRGAAIAEIREGLERGLDVSVYARIEFGWQQMREIRLGLENRVDIAPYLNVYYSWQQMREIRLGLENGIDIAEYKSLMNTASEMRKKRLLLQGDTVEQKETEHQHYAVIEAEQIARLSVTVSKDEMEAYIEVKEKIGKLSRDTIIKALKEFGVLKGLLEDTVEMLINGNCPEDPVLIARGKMPADGEDGWYEYFFKTENEWAPKMLADGSVDYQNTEWFEMVERGQKVAYYHSAGIGIDGYNVFGKALHARKGKELSMLAGKGFVLLPDQKTYLAAEDGKVELNNGRLEITRLLVLDEMTIATGKVDFDGSVYIKGNVGSGVTIRALEDIIIDGSVESANIECGGSVVLRQGMNASGNGMIKAGKNVTGKFFESVVVCSAGNIQANCSMNSQLYAEGEVVINGAAGTLFGGLAYANKGLQAYNVGNRVGLPTFIRIGTYEKMMQELRQIEEEILEVKREMAILQNAFVDFRKKYPPEVRNTMDVYMKIEKAIFTKETQLDQLEFANMEIRQKMQTAEDVKAVIRGTLFDGVTVEIGGTRWNSKSIQDVTLKKIGNRIAIYSNR